MTQIALPLDVRDGGLPVRVVVGNANRTVIEALADPRKWPFGTAVLVGPERGGKTLLARHLGADEALDVIDNAHLRDETEVFHAWNRAQERGRPLFLTARPGWQIALPDLASRLGGSLHLVIGLPDDAMMEDLLMAHAEQRRLALGSEAATYLVPRIERSFAAVEAIVEMIDRLSLERQVPATMSVWRDALEAVQGPEQGRLL